MIQFYFHFENEHAQIGIKLNILSKKKAPQLRGALNSI